MWTYESWLPLVNKKWVLIIIGRESWLICNAPSPPFTLSAALMHNINHTIDDRYRVAMPYSAMVNTWYLRFLPPWISVYRISLEAHRHWARNQKMEIHVAYIQFNANNRCSKGINFLQISTSYILVPPVQSKSPTIVICGRNNRVIVCFYRSKNKRGCIWWNRTFHHAKCGFLRQWQTRICTTQHENHRWDTWSIHWGFLHA